MSNSVEERLTFEEALDQLDRIVRELESDTVPLEQTVELYEKASKLATYCSGILEQAKLRIEQVNTNEAPS
jgi:exodeoxyribonuclease VII small subunit